MSHKHLPEYLSVTEDLGWILLRTAEGACLGVVLLVLGMAGMSLGELAITEGTLRPSALMAATAVGRQDVALVLGRLVRIGGTAVAGFAVAYVMEQLLMIKAYLRAIATGRGRLPEH